MILNELAIEPAIAMAARATNLLAPYHTPLVTSENWHNSHFPSTFCTSAVSQELKQLNHRLSRILLAYAFEVLGKRDVCPALVYPVWVLQQSSSQLLLL